MRDTGHGLRSFAERLERRTLFSGLASVSGGVATVNFDSSMQQITLLASGTNLTVTNATGDTTMLTGVSSVVVNGQPGRQILNVNAMLGSTDALEIQSGTVVLDPSGASDVKSISLGSLTVDAGATATVAPVVVPGTSYVLTVDQLNLAPANGGTAAGTLNLESADLIVHATADTSTAVLAAVNAWTQTAFDSASNDGTGIQPSSDPSTLTTLLVATAGADSSFDGVSVASTDILVRQTLIGDANFDGRVDGSDYTLIDNGYNAHLSGWQNGDFNGDGVVNGSDYTLIDNAFNTQPGYDTGAITTSDFPSTASQAFWLGTFSAGTYEGHNYQGQTGEGRLDTEIVGSSATFQAYISPNSSISITVDGTTTLIDSTATVFQFIPIFSNLSDSPHHVEISSAAPQRLYFDSDNTLQVTGYNPGLLAPAFAGPSGQAEVLPAWSAPFSTYAAFDGDPTYIAGYGEIWPAGGGGSGTGAGVRFRAAVTDISYWTNNNSGNLPRFVVYQDGLPIATSSIIPAQQSYWNVQPLVSGLDGAPHEYEIIPIDPGGYVQLFEVILGGGTGLITNAPEPVKPQWAFFGDTNVSGAGIATDAGRFGGDIRQTDAWMLTNLENVGVIIDGHPGATMDGYAVSHTSEITSLSPAPAAVFTRFGTDDVGHTPVAQFQSDYVSFLNALLAGLPGTTQIYVEGVFPATGQYFSPAQRSTYNAAMQAAVTSIGSSQVHYIDTTGWFDPAVDTNYVGIVDGLHPSAAGFIKILNREIPVVTSPSYNVVGPDAGLARQASALFTVTLGDGATFTGDQTIAISDGNEDGTFTPSFGSAAVSTLTVTPIAGTTSFTFTYTPAASGAKQLTFSNGQTGWSDPVALIFDALSG
jgi:hypothetical protein